MTTVAVPSYRKRVGYQAALLGGFATLAATLLVMGNISTRDAIAERQREDLLASLQQVIPDTLHDNNLLDDTVTLATESGRPLTVYRALKEGSVTGVAYRIVGKGYAGDIVLILGIDESGKILGTRVLQHAETPGLGDKIEIARDDWILGFDGRALDNTPQQQWAVKKDGGRFDQFSGATITPRAIVNAVHRGLTLFGKNRAQLLTPLPTTPEENADES